MKLTIRKNQAQMKGIFGNNKGALFELYGKCQITDAEKALIEKYKIEDHILASYNRPQKGEQPREVNITVGNMLNGRTISAENISMLLDLQNEMKAGCMALKGLLVEMATFGGEEIVDI